MYKLLLCQKYLRTRFIALASVISVMLGVATMIVVNSVMAGFSSQMKERIHGLLADVIVETHSLDGAADPDLLIAMAEKAAGEHIEAVTATVEVHGLLHFDYAGQWITRPVVLIGIDPEGKSKIGPLKDFLESHNEVREGDEIVAEPKRAEDQIPDWTLTDEAMKYRQEKVERQQWYEQQLKAYEDPNSEEAPVGSAWDAVASGGSTEDENSDYKVDTNDLLKQLEMTPDSTLTSSEPATGTGSTLMPDFGPSPVDDVDPAAPMRARIYVGAGLISFPYKDPQTGKTRIMKMLQPGDDVKISTATAGRPPKPAHFNATMVDVFRSGMSEYDSNLVFVNIEELQSVRGMLVPETGQRSITALQIKLKDYDDAETVVENLRAAFPADQFSVRTWEQKQGPLLAAVEIESAILNVLLFLIIAVAGFGILAIFYMIVVEKTRDIGILKALGASSRGVMSIFLSYGLGLGIVGSGVGVILGLVFVRYINEIESMITWLTGRKVFDDTIYYFPEIPTAVHPMMVLWVAVGAMTVAVLASVLPARRAARLHPVEALRYE